MLIIVVIFSILTPEAMAAKEKQKNYDIHSRAAWKHSRKCEFKCVNGQDPTICGTEEECAEFLIRDRHSDYLMYSVLGIMTFIFFFVCCVWDDHNAQAAKV